MKETSGCGGRAERLLLSLVPVTEQKVCAMPLAEPSQDTLPWWGWHFHRAVPREPHSHQHFPFGIHVLCWVLPSLLLRLASAYCSPSLPPFLNSRVFLHLHSLALAMNTLGRFPLLLASGHGVDSLSCPLGFCTCDDAGRPVFSTLPSCAISHN